MFDAYLGMKYSLCSSSNQNPKKETNYLSASAISTTDVSSKYRKDFKFRMNEMNEIELMNECRHNTSARQIGVHKLSTVTFWPRPYILSGDLYSTGRKNNV